MAAMRGRADAGRAACDLGSTGCRNRPDEPISRRRSAEHHDPLPRTDQLSLRQLCAGGWVSRASCPTFWTGPAADPSTPDAQLRRQPEWRGYIYDLAALRPRNDYRGRIAPPAVRSCAAGAANRARISDGAAPRADLQAVSRPAGPGAQRIDRGIADGGQIVMRTSTRLLFVSMWLAAASSVAWAAP